MVKKSKTGTKKRGGKVSVRRSDKKRKTTKKAKAKLHRKRQLPGSMPTNSTTKPIAGQSLEADADDVDVEQILSEVEEVMPEDEGLEDGLLAVRPNLADEDGDGARGTK